MYVIGVMNVILSGVDVDVDGGLRKTISLASTRKEVHETYVYVIGVMNVMLVLLIEVEVVVLLSLVIVTSEVVELVVVAKETGLITTGNGIRSGMGTI